MSPLLVIALVFFFVVLFSQFGSRLAARNSLIWWALAFFLVVATIQPTLLVPVAHALGVELVSNFVLGGLVLFLLLQIVEQSADAASAGRRFRELVSSLAAEEFVLRRPRGPEGIRRALIVVPSFNEAQSIPALLPKLDAITANADLHCDYCIVDDGSTDETRKTVQQLRPDRYLAHGANIGVAGALLTGFKIAQRCDYAFVVQCDGDGQHPPDEIPRMLREASERNLDLLIGSRFAAPSPGVDRLESTTWLRRLGGKIVHLVLAFFGRGAQVGDPTSGFRVYSARAVQTLIRMMPDEYPEPESIALLALRGCRIAEIQVRMAPRTAGRSTLAGFGSIRYMIKVTTALTGLRLRSLLGG